jgi:hypothetical protein
VEERQSRREKTNLRDVPRLEPFSVNLDPVLALDLDVEELGELDSGGAIDGAGEGKDARLGTGDSGREVLCRSAASVASGTDDEDGGRHGEERRGRVESGCEVKGEVE